MVSGHRLPRSAARHHKRLLPHIHSRLWQEMSTPTLKVWLVDGESVRNKLSVDFSLAGHDRVYKFVPHGEVWVESTLKPEDRKVILIHELTERDLMGKGHSYENAHMYANDVEMQFRNQPEGVHSKLKELLALNS